MPDEQTVTTSTITWLEVVQSLDPWRDGAQDTAYEFSNGAIFKTPLQVYTPT